jgi:hypothetical protein
VYRSRKIGRIYFLGNPLAYQAMRIFRPVLTDERQQTKRVLSCEKVTMQIPPNLLVVL